MLTKTLDPLKLRQAELSAERKYGPGWRTKDLTAHFAAMIEVEASPAGKATPATFKWWHVLLTAPNHETAAAEWLQEQSAALIYLPLFARQVRCRGRKHHVRLCAVIPGMLFAPVEIMEMARRDEVLEFAGVRDFIRGSNGDPARVSEGEIDKIRVIEAKLNLPPEAKGVLFKKTQEVRFRDEVLNAFWGSGIIFEIASETRIGVEVKTLFGRPGKVYVPASEIEAM
jgi:hypothetical protein